MASHRNPPAPTDHRHIEEQAANWIARRSDTGRPWGADEERALQAWRDTSLAHEVAYLRLDTAWHRADRIAALAPGVTLDSAIGWPVPGPVAETPGPAQATALPAPVSTLAPAALDFAALRFRPRTARRYRRWSVGLTAVLACAAVTASAVLLWRQQAAPEPMHLVTARGGTSVATLPDGSTVTLSSDTQVVVTYGRRTRQIELKQGEALFAVAKNPQRPFVVQAGDHRVTALGTQFSVRYSSADTRVILTEGKVRLDGAADTATGGVLMQPGDMAALAGTQWRLEHRTQEDLDALLAWRNGEVVLRRTPLKDAVEEFNRFNMRRIVVVDTGLNALRVDGGFRANNAESFIRLLELGFGVVAEHHPDRIELRRQ